MGDITDPTFRKEERVDASTLRVTRRSSFTGAVHTRDLSITVEEWDAFVSGRALIQEAMPGLAPDEREFLLTGSTQEEWDAAFAPDPDEEDLD